MCTKSVKNVKCQDESTCFVRTLSFSLAVRKTLTRKRTSADILFNFRIVYSILSTYISRSLELLVFNTILKQTFVGQLAPD